jgi:uncharacterized protein (TIGR01777 family)
MKVIIPGGSGQVGTILARAFVQEGDEVVVLGRKPVSANWRVVEWDAQTLGKWAAEFEGADVVINLAGRNVNCRYNQLNRQRIVESRVDATRVVGEAIGRAKWAPRVWLQASTATIYAHRYDAPNDEASGIIGGDEKHAPDTWRFSIEVAKAWERAMDEANTPGTRKVKLRSAMTMSPDAGGVFDVLLGLVRRGLGGQSGNGRQYVSWIHEQDFVRAIKYLIAHDEIEGAVNISAPNPLPNAEFMRGLRQAWGISFGLPAARWMLEIGAVCLRTETELILKSRRVVPGRLLAHGFTFDFANWPEAAADLCARWKQARGR